MTTHNLKTWPRHFGAVASGAKTFEARRDDRNFEVGDILVLREWEPEGDGFDPSDFDATGNRLGRYTGGTLLRYVTYILRDTEHVAPGHCILALGVHP